MIDFISNYLSSFQPKTSTEFTIFVVITMIFAALNIFLGYKLKRVWATLIGVGIGFVAGFILGGQIWQNSGAALIAGLVLAAIIGALAFFIYKLGIFLMCGTLAFLLVYQLLCGVIDDIFALIISIVFGLIVGVISIILFRPFIIVTTAVSGAFGFSNSLFALFPAAIQEQRFLGLSWPILLVGVILSAVGIIVQFVTTKKHAK